MPKAEDTVAEDPTEVNFVSPISEVFEEEFEECPSVECSAMDALEAGQGGGKMMTLDLEEGPVQQQQVSFESEQQEEEDAAPQSPGAEFHRDHADKTKNVDLGFKIGIGFGFGQEGCELEELQMEYNRKVMLRITSHVLGLKAGSLAYDDDIRQHMDMHKAAEISKLTQGAVSVPDVYYAADVEHIAEHLKWTLKRIDIPFTARDEETMVELENELTAGTVPFAQTQKAITQRVQQSKFCQMLSPIFGPVLHPLYKRNMGCTMFPFFLTVSPRDAVIPSILCMFVAGSIGAGIKQIWRAPRPFYIRPDLLKKGYESWGYSSPSLHSTMAACSSVFWTVRFQTPAHIVACVLLTVMTMVSRVYLGVHWASDVITGGALGTVVGLIFASDFACDWITEVFFESSSDPLWPALVMAAIINLVGVAQYVLYFPYGEIDKDLLTFIQGSHKNLPMNPGNIRKAWWSATTATGQIMGAAIVLNDEQWCTSEYVVGSANMTMVQLVALALCYCFSLYHVIEEWRKPLRGGGRKGIPIWQFLEGLYYLVFSFGTTLLGGLLLGCHEFEGTA